MVAITSSPSTVFSRFTTKEMESSFLCQRRRPAINRLARLRIVTARAKASSAISNNVILNSKKGKLEMSEPETLGNVLTRIMNLYGEPPEEHPKARWWVYTIEAAGSAI